MSDPKPFIKWVGGKRRLIPDIAQHLPPRIKSYTETFLGGGALFFHLMSVGALDDAVVVLSDMNDHLINAYRCVRDHLSQVKKRLQVHAEAHDEDYYYEVRAWNPYDLPAPARAAWFIYLNKTCFNGLYRVNKKGRFNVPMGRYANPNIYDPERLTLASEALYGVDIRRGDFAVVARERMDRGTALTPEDLFVFDPPYVPLTASANFTAYTKDGFTLEDQERLAELCHGLQDAGASFVAHNSDTAKTREVYAGLSHRVVGCGRTMGGKGSKRKKVNELIITPNQ